MTVNIDSLFLSSSSSSLAAMEYPSTRAAAGAVSVAVSPLQQFVWNVLLMRDNAIQDPSTINVTFVDDRAKCPTVRFIDHALENLPRHPESLHNLSMDNLYSSWNYDDSDSDSEDSFYTERLEDDDDDDELTAVSAPLPAIDDARWGESPTYMKNRKKIVNATNANAKANNADMGLVRPNRRISDDSYDDFSFFAPTQEDEKLYEELMNKQQQQRSTKTNAKPKRNSFSETTTSTRATVSVDRIITQAIDLANSPKSSSSSKKKKAASRKKSSSKSSSSTSSSSSSKKSKTKTTTTKSSSSTDKKKSTSTNNNKKKSSSSSPTKKKNTKTVPISLAQKLERLVHDDDEKDTVLVAVDSLVEQVRLGMMSTSSPSTPSSPRKTLVALRTSTAGTTPRSTKRTTTTSVSGSTSSSSSANNDKFFSPKSVLLY